MASYSFHHRCGSCAKISNRSRSAERAHPLAEFNKAVVISERPLQDGKAFQVKIDSKASTWTGSILIGATTVTPNKFRFPPSIASSSDGWVFNGETLWRNGVRSSYGGCSLTALREGDTVGVMRQGRQLQFLVNGQNQGVADDDLSEESVVYALVDLYGRCTKVTVVSDDVGRETSASGAANTMVFHTSRGKEVILSDGGSRAGRRNPRREFNNGVVLTSRPLRDSELFEVEITEMVDKWSGSIEMGVTSHSPNSFTFPSTMTNATTGAWMMSGSGIIHNGDTIRENYGRSLDSLKVGDHVGVMRNPDASLVFFVNGRPQGEAVRDLPRELYGVVDVYGRCCEVRITGGEASSSPAPASGQTPSLPRRPPQVVDMDQPLLFHAICSENAEISSDQRSARRLRPMDEFSRATVLSSRPLKAEEWFEVVIGDMVDAWSGSVQIGVCDSAPEELNFDEFSEASDRERGTWILSGMDLIHEGSPLHDNYSLDLDELSVGSKVGVMVMRNGNLHFSLNGSDMGCAAKDVPSGVYAVVDIYGQCTKVSLSLYHGDAGTSHVTPAPPTEAGVPIPRSEEPGAGVPMTTTAVPSGSAFHPKCGKNVRLSDNGCVASRVNGYEDGVTFSGLPLREGEVFKVELVKLDDTWSGLMRVGLTTCDPSKLAAVPSSCSGLPSHTWVMTGSSFLVDGQVVLESYGRSLSRLQTGDTIGVQRSAEGALHVHINDVDLGPAVYGIPEVVFAVLDLYGNTSCVRAVGYGAVSDKNIRDKEPEEHAEVSEEVLQFSTSHGPHVEVSDDGQSARRTSSYSKAIVVSSIPLPTEHLFQVEIRQLETKWSGSVMVGVTALPPQQACLVNKASQLRGQSYVLCTSNEATCLFVDGQEKLYLQDPTVDLLSLQPGNTVGVLCKSNGTLQFYVNGQPLPQPPHKVPKTVYGVVDLYGQCSEVRLQPLTTASMQPDSSSPSPTSSHSRARSCGWKSRTRKPGVDEQVSSADIGSLSDLSRARGDKEDRIVQCLGIDLDHICDLRCPYWRLCERFLRSLAIPDVYFDRTPAYNKCYCEDCRGRRREPPVKFQGDPPMKYSVPQQWAKFAISVHEARAKNFDIFRKWHVAYHGTAVGNIRSILDDGELMIPGDRTIGGRPVTRPKGHFTEQHKPEGLDVNQIFLSPSLKYCSQGNIYAKKQSFRDPETRRQFWAKVALKVRIQPGDYQVLPQTVRSTGGERIDENFDNGELEWGTNRRKAIMIVGLLVRLDSAPGT